MGTFGAVPGGLGRVFQGRYRVVGKGHPQMIECGPIFFILSYLTSNRPQHHIGNYPGLCTSVISRLLALGCLLVADRSMHYLMIRVIQQPVASSLLHKQSYTTLTSCQKFRCGALCPSPSPWGSKHPNRRYVSKPILAIPKIATY